MITTVSVDLLFHRQAFKIRCYEARGDEFQYFFEKVMIAGYKDFISIRAYGNIGDMKCDGRIKSAFFQVYSPDTEKASEVIKKIEEDFHGALKHWKAELKEWIFVFNAHRGIPSTVVKKMDALKKKYPHIAFTIWNKENLWEIVEQLPLRKRIDLLGVVPTIENVNSFNVAELDVILKFLTKKKADNSRAMNLTPVKRKIKENDFSDGTVDLIKIGLSRSEFVNDYLNMHPDPSFSAIIKESLLEVYENLVTKYDDNNIVFGKLHATCCMGDRDNPDVQAAALAVIVYYFELCEVFSVE